MASAVAAPMPRLAPVTTASRPASQCLASTTDCGPGTGADDFPVEPFVSVETALEIEVALGMGPAVRARQFRRSPECIGRHVDFVGGDQEARQSVDDDLGERAA